MAAHMVESYDSAFLGILQHEGNITNFLDVVYGFLYRRTDFYRIMKSKEDKIGFPPGVAHKLTVQAFQKYANQAEKDEEVRKKLQNLETLKDQQAAKSTVTVKEITEEDKPPVSKGSSRKGGIPSSHTTTISHSKTEQKSQSATTVSTKTMMSSNVETTKNNPETAPTSKDDAIESSSKTETGTSVSESANSNPAEGGDTKGTASKRKAQSADDDDDDKVDPELAAAQKVYQANAESFNGAIRDNYSWSQSITDTDLRINIPPYVKKGKEVKVTIERKRVKAEHKDDTGSWQLIVDNELCWDINKEESMWSLVPGEHIHVNLEKVQERWWDAVFVNEPKLSVRKMECSRPMTDLDDEAQTKIEQMMYDDHRKKLGLPTHEEQKMQDMLKKAWDAEGSPFKGTPFDPSKVNLQGNNAFPMNPPQ